LTSRIVPIDSADDPAIAAYTRVRERDLVGREGLFVAEGEVVVRVLASRSRFAVRSLLLERRRVQGMRDVIERLDDRVPVYVAPQDVMDAIVGFPIHRGVLALGERGLDLHADEVLRREGMLVALVALTNHDNVGGVFRNAAAFGAGAVLLDRATCDPLYRKAIRVSAGAALVVPFARCGDALDLVERLERDGREVLALTPQGEVTLDEVAREPVTTSTRRAIVLGTEGAGLPPEVLARARRVRIAMAPGWDSLNVAVASGVALAALRAR
jgi:tRNA G18 (ribose-2'-O)-methylase SpoU